MEAAGYKVKEFVFVAQENTQPFASKVFKITNEQMDVACLTMEKHLHAYMRHLKGEKPTVYNSPNVVTLDLDDEV